MGNAEYMGSPAGVSSLLTSTDMKSIMFLALFLVAAVFCEAEAEAEASPDAYYGYYGHHGLVHGYGHLGYAHHGYGHLGYHGYGLHSVRGRLSLAMDTMATMVMATTDTAIL